MILTSVLQIFQKESESSVILCVSRMADISLVQVGYAREIDSVFHARCTIGLITLDEHVIEHDEHTQKPEIAPVKTILFDCGAAHESKEISESKANSTKF